MTEGRCGRALKKTVEKEMERAGAPEERIMSPSQSHIAYPPLNTLSSEWLALVVGIVGVMKTRDRLCEGSGEFSASKLCKNEKKRSAMRRVRKEGAIGGGHWSRHWISDDAYTLTATLTTHSSQLDFIDSSQALFLFIRPTVEADPIGRLRFPDPSPTKNVLLHDGVAYIWIMAPSG
ncbi:hypothetical protein MPER_12675 [Moniliophthora perniciosa FA553]|nr:hypothetical protein MPER_12675 [Moniliophthora perniciosa FA553]